MSRERIAQPLMIALLAALLAAPALVERLRAKPLGGAPLNRDAIIDRFGFALAEVAKQSGVDFVHSAPTFDPRFGHIMPQIASMGAAVSVVDFDRDGWNDLYVTNSGERSRNRLYRNNHDGSFTDVAESIGLADVNRDGTGVSTGAVWADYDNDGFDDLLLYKYGKPELFHNDGGKWFTPVSDRAGLPAWVNAGSAIWFDFDRDGFVDIFIAGYWREDVDLWRLKSTKVMPESFEYAENGGRKYLLRNRGDGTFEDVTEQMGITSRRWTLAAAAGSLCGSAFPDLFLANDYGVPELFENVGGKSFREIGDRVIGSGPKSGMNASFGDVLNDGCLAIYKTNISEEGVLIQGNDLWIPRHDEAGRLVKYDNLANAMGVELGGWSWGAQFGDFNNDGAIDLYMTNGYVSADRGTSYWYDFSKIAGGHSSIIADAKNWPPMGNRSLSGYQHKKLWLNDGAGRFKEVAQAVGATDVYDGRAVAVADLFNRGVLDLVVANQRGPLLIYRNEVSPENRWIAFELEGSRGSNRSAIGAQVRVFWNGAQQLQEVSGGNGFSAQNQRRLHFGLGQDPKIEKIVVRWPSGRTQTLPGLEVNQLHRLREPQDPR